MVSCCSAANATECTKVYGRPVRPTVCRCWYYTTVFAVDSSVFGVASWCIATWSYWLVGWVKIKLVVVPRKLGYI